MADHSAAPGRATHERDDSQSFCFHNASAENSCFDLALFCFISVLCLRVAVLLNATRRDKNLLPFTCKEK